MITLNDNPHIASWKELLTRIHPLGAAALIERWREETNPSENVQELLSWYDNRCTNLYNPAFMQTLN